MGSQPTCANSYTTNSFNKKRVCYRFEKRMWQLDILVWVKGFAIFWCNMRHYLATLKAFAEVVKMTNHTRVLDVVLAWNSPSATWQICLYGSEHRLGIHAFRPTWPYLIIKVLCNLSKVSWTVWLLYCDQLCLHLLHNKCFWFLLQCYGPVWTHKV